MQPFMAAARTRQSLPVVARVFEVELAPLKADARITDYLVLVAAHRTRDTLLATHP